MQYYFWFNPDQYEIIREWCKEELGPFNERITWQLLGNNDIGGEVLFTYGEDAMAFKLRWS